MTIHPDGAGAIVYYKYQNTTWILIGQEGRYLSDLHRISEGDIRTSKNDPAFYRNKAKSLMKKYGVPIQYDKIVKKGDKYEVEWRTPMKSWGFPKGGREGSESVLETLSRELIEEVGIPIIDKFNPEFLLNVEQSKGTTKYIYSFYKIEVTREYAQIIEESIKKKSEEYSGEMFNLGFRPINELERLDTESRAFNQKSLKAFRKFAQQPENIGLYYMSRSNKYRGGKGKRSIGAGVTECISKRVYLRHKSRRHKSKHLSSRSKKFFGGGYLLEPTSVIGGRPEVIAVHEPLLPKYSPEPIRDMETYVPSLLKGDEYGSQSPESLQPFSPEAQYSPAEFKQLGGRRKHKTHRRRNRQHGGSDPYGLAGLNSNFNADAMMRTYNCSEPYWNPNCV